MRKLLLFTALVVLTARAFCREKILHVGCDEVAEGKTRIFQMLITTSASNPHTLKFDIRLKNLGGNEQATCSVRWSVSDAAGKDLISYAAEPNEPEMGLEFIGSSPDGTKLLFDFWTAAGDYTDHRPAVYDFTLNRSFVRNLGNRITHDLPSCDYYEVMESVTNDGNVIIRVPKGSDTAESCRDQGRWLLNMSTNRITRLKRQNAISKKSAH